MNQYLRRVLLLNISILLAACTAAKTQEADTMLALTQVPAPRHSAEPNLVLDTHSQPVLSWVVKNPANGMAALEFSRFTNNRWLPAVEVSRGADWFVNWADFPSVLPLTRQHWAAHWLVKSGEHAYTYDVAFAQSFDGGNTWSRTITPHTDHTQSEHGFVSLFPDQGGVGMVWLDGRETLRDDGGMTLRSAVVDQAGQLSAEHLVDDLVCDCCQTAAAKTKRGTILAYRNRTTAEVRDIFVSRREKGAWTPGVAVSHDNWEIAGCPVNGPAISALGDTVALAWFTMAGGQAKVRLAWSSDGGVTFNKPMDIDGGTPLGRVDVKLRNAQTAVVSWLRQISNQGAHIVLKQIKADGTGESEQIVAATLASRVSGFPQLVLYQGRALVAWTAAQEAHTQVKVATIALSQL